MELGLYYMIGGYLYYRNVNRLSNLPITKRLTAEIGVIIRFVIKRVFEQQVANFCHRKNKTEIQNLPLLRNNQTGF